MHRAAALVLAVVAYPAFAHAADQPITGAKLVMKRSSSGKQMVVFQSKDPSFPFPPILDPQSPETLGATIEIFSPGILAPDPFVAPRNPIQPGWTAKGGGVPTHKYKRDKVYAATTPIKSIVMKDGHGVSFQADATGIPLDGARGTVAIRITVGDQRSCARFTGAAVTKDVTGAFMAKNATIAGLVDCAVTSLTGDPPTCGDHDVNQPQEQCDPTGCNVSLDNICRPPGTSNECTCCSNGGFMADTCCNPSSIAYVVPISVLVCVPTRCDPPDACNDGDQCQADHSCCTTIGGNACVKAYAPPISYGMVPLNACCPGLECSRQTGDGAGCCASGGTMCAGDGDCCTGHCQVGGTCEACSAGATACATAQECCSGSCTGGLCDACAPAGTFCSSGATCCSGTCTEFQCQP